MSQITILPQNETLELKALDTQQIDGFLALVREAKIFWILKIKIKFITMNKKNQKKNFTHRNSKRSKVGQLHPIESISWST